MAAVLSIGTTTKRRSAEAGGGALVMRRDRGGTRWEDCSCRFGRRIGQRKKQKEGYGISFKRPPLAETTQQPTDNSNSDGAGIRYKNRAWRNAWEGRLSIVLDGDSSDKK